MPWRWRTLIALLVFLAVMGTGGVLDHLHRQRAKGEYRAAVLKQQQYRAEARAAAVGMNEYLRSVRPSALSSREVQAELLRRSSEVNRLTAAAAGVRVPNPLRPWPYAKAWLGAALAAVVLGAGWSGWEYLRERRRAALRASGRCDVCGYDVRFSSDRCPECGTLVHGRWVRVPVGPDSSGTAVLRGGQGHTGG